MPTINIDEHSYEVQSDDNLLQQVLRLGLDLPYFCWHPALGSVGACRQCAVIQYRDEKDSKGTVVMACMTAVKDGMRFSIDHPEAQTFRRRVIEWLMVNHPHDCPVCDEGGECHLQDMTVMTGHAYRNYRFEKRTFVNQNLGPFLAHEMNRCITCYRCVRFYGDYAGGRDLQAFASRNRVYFGRHQNGALENVFSGNLAEVCPTGVFTDKTLKHHYTRKWDLQNGPSVCVHCAAGCNTQVGQRYGTARRILNRYNSEVNGYFICDRGRYGYEFVNSPLRIKSATLRDAGSAPQKLPKQTAIDMLRAGGQPLIGIGSPRASVEANFALRSLVGAEHFYSGVSAAEFPLLNGILEILQHGPAPTPTLEDIEQSDAILILGEALDNTAPRIALACRQGVRQKSIAHARDLGIPRWLDGLVREAAGEYLSPMFVITPRATSLDDIATALRFAPADIARFGFAVAHALEAAAPSAEGFSAPVQEQIKTAADVLRSAERPLIISGTSCGDLAVIQAAANIAKALLPNRRVRLYYALPESNSLGLALLRPKPLAEAFAWARREPDQITALVLENDLYRRAHRGDVEAFCDSVHRLVVIDHLQTPTTQRAHFVLPAATFAESTGTLVSAEGRMQRFFAAMPPADDIAASWEWLASFTAGSPKWRSVDDVISQCASEITELRRMTEAAPLSDYRIQGMKIPRAPHRFSGRTAMHADQTMHEPKPTQDRDSPLAFSMEGFQKSPPAAVTPFYWTPGWNSPQAQFKGNVQTGGVLRDSSPGVRAFVPDDRLGYFSQPPPAFSRRDGQWLLLALPSVFGGEELSARAPAIQERTPRPYVALNEADARAAGISDGDLVEISLRECSYSLPCRWDAAVAAGVAVIPAEVDELSGVSLPAWVQIQ